MRKLMIVASSGLLLARMLVAPAGASSGDENLILLGEFTNFEVEDHGRHGRSEGDRVRFEFDVLDNVGVEAGTGDGECVVTDRHDDEFSADCAVAFVLDDDELNMEGEVGQGDLQNNAMELAVVDGTGDFDDAEGMATFQRHYRHCRHGDSYHDAADPPHHHDRYDHWTQEPYRCDARDFKVSVDAR